MIYFPQMATGAMGQYPLNARRIQRTIINDCPDGRRIKLADPGGASVRWQLDFQELTDGELSSIQQFFQSTEGRLNGFSLLDPTGNLIAWSEKLDQPVWLRTSALTIESNIPDPAGSTRAARITNASGAALTLQQTLNAPGWFSYCLSAFGRSDQSDTLVMLQQTAAGTATQSFPLQSEWRRFVFATKAQTAAESISFGFQVPNGSSIDLFGIQVEAQPGASSYKPTASGNGVYPNARVDDDKLTITSYGPDRHSCTVAIVSQPNG